MKSKGMLTVAHECYEELDGEETLMESCEEPLDLRLKSHQTHLVTLKPGTDNSVVNNSQHLTPGVEISEPNQLRPSVRFAERDNVVHSDGKTSQLRPQEGVSVVRPTPIYCCRAQNTNGNNAAVLSNHNCLSKTFYQTAASSNLNSSDNISNMLKTSQAHRWNYGTNIGQGIMGILRTANRDLLAKSDRWSGGPELCQEMIKIDDKKGECDLMKIKNADNRKTYLDKLEFDENVPDNDSEAASEGQYKLDQMCKSAVCISRIPTSSKQEGDQSFMYSRDSLDICGAGSSDKDKADHGICPEIPREGTDTPSESDNSFEVLFEYLSNRDEQNSSETFPDTEVAENGNELPVLQGCEDILDPKPGKDLLVEGGGIPELVEPFVSPSLDFMEGCRLSTFSVFNQFSHTSKSPDPILFPSSLSFTSSDDEKIEDEEAVLLPHNIKPVATVFPFQEECIETYPTISRPVMVVHVYSKKSIDQQHKEKSADQQYSKGKEKTITAEDSSESTPLDLSSGRNRPSLQGQCTGDENKLEGKTGYNHGRRIMFSRKPTLSFLNNIQTNAVGLSSQMESTFLSSLTKPTPSSFPGKLKLSAPIESTLPPKRYSDLPSIHREWNRFSSLPSLHEETSRFSLRESALPSHHRESDLSSTAVESLVSPSLEVSSLSASLRAPPLLPSSDSTVPSLVGKTNMLSSDTESISVFPYRDSLPQLGGGKTDLTLLEQKHSTNFVDKSSSALSMSSQCKLSSLHNDADVSSAVVNDFERDMRMLSMFSDNLEESGKWTSQNMRGIKNSPVLHSPDPGLCLPKSQSHSSPAPSSTILTSMSNSQIVTSSVPNSRLVTSVFSSPITSSLPCATTITSVPNLPLPTPVPNLPLPTSVPSLKLPTSVPNLPLPTSMPNLPLPTSAPNLPLPTSVPSLTLPTSVPNLPLPTSVPNLPLPTSVPSLKLPTSVPNLPLPTSMPNLPLPTSAPNLPLPTSVPSLTLPTSVPNLPLPTSVPNLPLPTSVPNLTLPTSGSVPNLPMPTSGSVPNLPLPTPGSVPNLPLPTSVPNLPITTCMSNSQVISSLPNLPISTSVLNLQIPSSSVSNSHTLASLQNSPILSTPSELNLPISPIITSSVSKAASIHSIPKLSTLTANVLESPSPQISSVLNIQPSASVPNVMLESPCSSTEKLIQQGTKLSPPMKHKQMLIEKYKMSVNSEKLCRESRNDTCNTELYDRVEKPAVESPRTRIAGKGSKHQLSKTNRSLSFSELGDQGNPCSPAKVRKLLTQEHKDHCESVGNDQSLQPHDLKACETFYWCHVCEKSVKCEKDANRHQTIHGYNTKANLLFYYLQVYGCVTLHWRGYNRVEKCVYLCGLCDRTIPYISGFKRHIQTHGHNVTCDLCSKSFDDTERLQDHKLSHSEPRSCEEKMDQGFFSRTTRHGNSTRSCSSATNKCRFCGKFFSSRSSLTIHMRLHTGQNPYKCRLCDRSYPQNVQLKLHMKAHKRLGDI